MHTHENAKDSRAKLDFCWTVKHENLHNCYSQTVINSTPRQAFVAGYREGVKMSLEKGERVSPSEFRQRIWAANLKILTTWMSVGAEVENGQYAMLGARIGCYKTALGDDSLYQISDLDMMKDIYDQNLQDHMTNLDEELKLYGESIRTRLDIPVAELDAEQSRFFKYCMPPHVNKGVQDREY